jgi:hypothetical protein
MCGKGEGTIRIRRIGEIFMSMEPLTIYIDGRCQGRILSGDSKEFKVHEGSHRIRIQLESPFLGSFPSNTLNIRIREDRTILLECGSTYKGVKVLVSRFYLFNRNGTFYIKESVS